MVMRESDAGSVLVRLDNLAAQLITQANPLRFGVAHSQTELEAVFRLRYLTVIEKGWAKPDDFPGEFERDADDDRAIQVVAWDRDAPAATARIVLPAAGALLPTEGAFGVNLRTCGRVVDVGRVCVSPAYRDREHRVWIALLGQTWLEVRVRGFTQVCSIMTPSVARIYRSIGLQVIPLGDSRNYWGKERFPALVPLGDTVFELLSRLRYEPEELMEPHG